MISIGGKKIGPGHPCFVIAEAGVNHNGDIQKAKRLVRIAKDVGADAVKFQTFCAERLVTSEAPKAEYQARNTAPKETQYQMLRKLELSASDHNALIDECRAAGILFLSTPFDEISSDMLDALKVPAFKLPSGELTNLAFLSHVAKKGKPMLVSTGMADLGEVADAVKAIKKAGGPPLVLLHCVSSYPADPGDANLRAMETMRKTFKTPVGFSDHTLGFEVSLAAVALGACVIEKHITLDRGLPGPDHAVSLEPDEFAAMVRAVRNVERALGDGRKQGAASEADAAKVARKSLVAARPISKGAVFTAEALVVQRPGTGLPPSELQRVLGKKARKDIPAGKVITKEMVS